MSATDQQRVPGLDSAASGGIESVTQAGGYVFPKCPDVREDGRATCPKRKLALEATPETLEFKETVR